MTSPFFLLLGVALVVLQTVISELLFFGRLTVELSLIAVIYAGFHQSFLRGIGHAFILGFLQDCFMGSVTGLFVSSYLLIFLLAKFVSLRFYAERFSFIMIFVGLCALLEGTVVTLFYRLAYDVDKFHYLWDVFLPQALLAGMAGPLLFKLFGMMEVSAYGRASYPIKQ